MEYAVIRTGGKQYKVSPGDTLEIDKLPQEKDSTITFDALLWVSDPSTSSGQVGRHVKIGTPVVSDVKVKAKVVDQVKGDKIRVAKFKSKVRYRRVMGFRAQLTRIQIEKIESGKASAPQAQAKPVSPTTPKTAGRPRPKKTA